MNINEFCEKVKNEIAQYLGEEVAVSVNQVTKNNGIVLNSVIITRKERNLSPNIYLDEQFEAYEQGKEFTEIVSEVLRTYEQSERDENMNMDFFLCYEQMKKRVVYKMIGYKKNENLLKNVPHIVFLDMVIVFYCYVPGEEQIGNATILIYNNHLSMWEITKEQLYEDAIENTKRILPIKVLSIEKIMEEIFAEDLKKEFYVQENELDGIMPEEEWFDKAARQLLSSVTDYKKGSEMFVMGNEYKLFGAIAILYEGALEAFSERFSRDIYILPSSIHEVILVPSDNQQIAESLWKMVCEINETQVDPEEVLTDSLYFYSRKNGKIAQVF